MPRVPFEKFVAQSRDDARRRWLLAALMVVLAVGLSVLAQVMRTQRPAGDRGTWQFAWGATLVVGLVAGVILARHELARSAAGSRATGRAALGAGLVFFVILPRLPAGVQAGGLGLLAGVMLGAAVTAFLSVTAPPEDSA
jgi:hypothetical protein